MRKLLYIAICFASIATAQTYTGGTTVSTGFNVSDPQPSDDRTVADDSTGLVSIHDKFEGLPSYNKNNDHPYWYNGSTWDKGALFSDLSYSIGTVNLQTVLTNGATATITDTFGLKTPHIDISATNPAYITANDTIIDIYNNGGNLYLSQYTQRIIGPYGAIGMSNSSFSYNGDYGQLLFDTVGLTILDYSFSRYLYMNDVYGIKFGDSTLGYSLQISENGLGVGEFDINYYLPLTVDGSEGKVLKMVDYNHADWVDDLHIGKINDGNSSIEIGYSNTIVSENSLFIGDNNNEHPGNIGAGNNLVIGSQNSLLGGTAYISNNFINGYGNTVDKDSRAGGSGYGTNTFGSYNINKGIQSTQIGSRLIGSSFSSTIVGIANVDISTDPKSYYNSSNPIFQIGNGRVDAWQNVVYRSTAAAFYQNGAFRLFPTGVSDITNQSEGMFVVDSTLHKLRYYDHTGGWKNVLLEGELGSADGNDFVTAGSFNTSTGNVTLTIPEQSSVTYSLDGRYSLDDSVVHTTGDEIIAGKKTFSIFPITPEGHPENDLEVANKSYVDARIGVISDSEGITYNNTISGLSSTNVETAITELHTNATLTKTLTRKLITNGAVTGTYNLDYSNFATQYLTLTGNTTLTQSNLPSSDEVRTVSLYVTGNYTLALPAAWNGKVKSGVYDGTKLNLIIVQVIGDSDYWITINN